LAISTFRRRGSCHHGNLACRRRLRSRTEVGHCFRSSNDAAYPYPRGTRLRVWNRCATGWIFKLIRAWPFFATNPEKPHSRTARLASPFVAALSIALALWVTARVRSHHGEDSSRPRVARQDAIERLAHIHPACCSCAPSLIAFWDLSSHPKNSGIDRRDIQPRSRKDVLEIRTGRSTP